MTRSRRAPDSARPRRSAKHRGPRKTVHVIVEGRTTEPAYFAAYKRLYRKRLNIHVASHQGETDPMSLVSQAVDLQSSSHRGSSRSRYEHGDPVWVVCDRDQHPELVAAQARATRHGIGLALSTPCIELWFMLHHQDFRRSTSSREMKRLFYSQISSPSERLPDAAASHLLEHAGLARQRAQALARHHETAGSSTANPSSDLWRLIEQFEILAADAAP